MSNCEVLFPHCAIPYCWSSQFCARVSMELIFRIHKLCKMGPKNSKKVHHHDAYKNDFLVHFKMNKDAKESEKKNSDFRNFRLIYEAN